MGRRAKTTEGQWGHPWASTEPRAAPTEATGEHWVEWPLPPASSPPQFFYGMLAAGPSHPHLSPLSSPSPILLPSLTCCLWHPATVPWPVPASLTLAAHGLYTLGSFLFHISSHSHLLGSFPLDALSPIPRTFLESPTPSPSLSHSVLAPLPASDSTQPGQRVSSSGSGLVALAEAPETGASVPAGP